MPLTILLADDSVTAQNVGKKILAAAGYDVVTATNGVAAIKIIAERHPDIALLDVYMPGYTGVELCKMTKATAVMAQMPILLTVGKMEPFCVEETIRIKADGLIIKPFDVTNLITAVEKLAEHVRASEPVSLRSNVVNALQESKGLAVDPQLRPEQKQPERHPTLHTPTPERSEVQRVIPATRDKTARRDLLRQQGGEVCDVCGLVNPEVAFACQRCDVPLPRTVPWAYRT